MSAHASGLNFCAFLRAEADAAEDKARRLRIQAAALTQTAGLGIGECDIVCVLSFVFVVFGWVARQSKYLIRALSSKPIQGRPTKPFPQ